MEHRDSKRVRVSWVSMQLVQRTQLKSMQHLILIMPLWEVLLKLNWISKILLTSWTKIKRCLIKTSMLRELSSSKSLRESSSFSNRRRKRCQAQRQLNQMLMLMMLLLLQAKTRLLLKSLTTKFPSKSQSQVVEMMMQLWMKILHVTVSLLLISRVTTSRREKSSFNLLEQWAQVV